MCQPSLEDHMDLVLFKILDSELYKSVWKIPRYLPISHKKYVFYSIIKNNPSVHRLFCITKLQTIWPLFILSYKKETWWFCPLRESSTLLQYRLVEYHNCPSMKIAHSRPNTTDNSNMSRMQTVVQPTMLKKN